MNANPPESHQQDPGSIQIRYFVPNQVVLHLEHPPGIEPESLMERIAVFIKERSDVPPWSYLVDLPQAGRLITFDRGEQGTFSIVPIPFKDQPDDMDTADEFTADVIRQFYEQIISGENDLGDGVTLASAAPNWLMGAASHQIGLGGPGNFPERADPPEAWPHLHLPDGAGGATGKGIHVAILDTAPCPSDLYRAYYERHGEHRLLEGLVGSGGVLRVYPASREDIELTADYSLGAHRYLMPDHGLFVAGIIHTLAQGAALHLYEVLNPYGVGCLETIARGLFRALTDAGVGRPLVINCSFMLGAALGEGFDPDLSIFEPGLFDNLTLTVRELFQGIGRQDVAVVAAAGNDGVDCQGAHVRDRVTGRRPPARYPAAYAKVIGVGALPVNPRARGTFQKASYSNRPDEPPDIGYASIGGEAGAGAGVRSAYIGLFPERIGAPPANCKYQHDQFIYRYNDSGWAWWSGTSFAAPMVSGSLAVRWSANTGLTENQARATLVSAPATADDQEKVILVNT